jgi:hypothetical protein
MISSPRLTREQLATRQAKILLGCYRRTDAIDPEIYMHAIGCVLAGYDEDIIVEATHPRFGIQGSEKFRAFPPNSGELKQFCENLAERNHRQARLRELPRVSTAPRLPPPDLETRPPGWRANLYVPNTVAGYERMIERAKSADRGDWCWYSDHPKWGSGIKVRRDWWS